MNQLLVFGQIFQGNTEKLHGDNKGDEANLERVQRTPEDEEDATRGKESNFVPQRYHSRG
ncbi:hypothetical protein K0M31_015922 [Melipona bicolor]|uniref:Uncharacterized protein n=1 Tax=Melipona bicolor TaxID=60889 RepID=A0AA40G663_9HYME|nr:hypothetical protein K0M31_015922 [Melipona bicolor]